MSTKEKNMDARIAFGNSLSEKRRESGFSQEELGLKIGKSSNAVSRYENAENTMDVHTFAKTVNALKASPFKCWCQIYPGSSCCVICKWRRFRFFRSKQQSKNTCYETV